MDPNQFVIDTWAKMLGIKTGRGKRILRRVVVCCVSILFAAAVIASIWPNEAR